MKEKKPCVGKLALVVTTVLAYGGVAVVAVTLAGCASLDRAKSAIECSVRETYVCLSEDKQEELQ